MKTNYSIHFTHENTPAVMDVRYRRKKETADLVIDEMIKDGFKLTQINLNGRCVYFKNNDGIVIIPSS